MSEKSSRQRARLAVCVTVLLASLSNSSVALPPSKHREAHHEHSGKAVAVWWSSPTDIRSRDLYYGPGGKQHAPHTTFTFLKEDLAGTSPKFSVRDEDGTKWKVKLGPEARPETVASRLVWAVGYYANEDYFLPELHVQNMPRLKRGQRLVERDGTMHNVRLKREVKNEKKLGSWKWGDNRFNRQRELNGLRVIMALINNWDLKDTNNSIYEEKDRDSSIPKLHYAVSDLGASFGTTGRSWTQALSKGNLRSYRHSKFIRKVTPEYVDLNVPTRPALIYVFTPKEFVSRIALRWIGKRISRSDAKWIGGLLAQLSPEQVRDAFRAAGYSPEQVEGFAEVVEARIAELNNL